MSKRIQSLTCCCCGEDAGKFEQHWAEDHGEDHGYILYRCPHCHTMYYSDSGPVGNCPCGWMPDEDETGG
jgi:hypothetical protein